RSSLNDDYLRGRMGRRALSPLAPCARTTPGVRPLLQSTIIKKAAIQLHLLFIWWSQGDYARNPRSILYGMSHSRLFLLSKLTQR
ncbi:hypothetical protein, partial [Paenibacillus alvei]|uniref:hypothetical protein n=1 Tax=Paenibacillus alvei TaxID=44250 RepID=UPI002280B619